MISCLTHFQCAFGQCEEFGDLMQELFFISQEKQYYAQHHRYFIELMVPDNF